jgi:hypothetical protein
MKKFIYSADHPIGEYEIEKMKKVDILELDDCFNHPLDNIPNNIKTIQIVSNKNDQYYPDFNQPLDNLPLGLEKLIVKTNNYSYTLDNLPVGLKYFKFVHINCFSNNNLFCNLPSSLEYLGIFTFKLPIDRKENEPLLNLNNLPSTLKVLEIPLDSYEDCNNLPCSLDTLILHSRNDFEYKLETKLQLPSNLNMLILNIDSCDISYYGYSSIIEKVFNNKLTCKYLYINSYQEYYGGQISRCRFNEEIIDIRMRFPNVMVLCDYTL